MPVGNIGGSVPVGNIGVVANTSCVIESMLLSTRRLFDVRGIVSAVFGVSCNVAMFTRKGIKQRVRVYLMMWRSLNLRRMFV